MSAKRDLNSTSDPRLVAKVDESSYEVDEWIPGPKDVSEVYKKLLRSRSDLNIHHILPKSRKIGQKTFSEGCFDGILLRACQMGNIQVVSYLLRIFTQYFSIDTLIDSLTVRIDLHHNNEKTRFDKLRNDKVSLLHSAAVGSQLDVVELLLSAGANVNNPSSWLITPLLSALQSSIPLVVARCRILSCLIKSGANVHHRDADGLTSLMYAAKLADVRSTKILLQAGADPYAVNHEGCTALHYACFHKHTAVVRYLLKVAPRLILLRGEHSLTCVAPYITAFRARLNAPAWISHRNTDLSVIQLFLDDPDCPSEIKVDLMLLRIVSHVIFYCPFSISSVFVDRIVQHVESAIEFGKDSNIPVPVSSPIAAYGNCPELLNIKDIKSIDSASLHCKQQLVLQCLVTAERCFGYASIEIMQMLSVCLGRSQRTVLKKESLGLALRLSEMLLFRLENKQCLTQTSWVEVIRILWRFLNVAALNSTHVLLDRAISVFIALVHSQQRVSTSCVYTVHNVLHFSSHLILNSLASLGTSDETVCLVTKLTNCNCPLLVDKSSGYPQSLLHVALFKPKFLSLPLLETFLNCGGDRWINTPGVNGRRPLHLDCTKEVALLLVDHGAHLDAVDADGSIPEYSNEYYKSHTRPLSCIVARFIVKTGGIMAYGLNLLPAHVQVFVSLHDSRATRLQIDSQAAESY